MESNITMADERDTAQWYTVNSGMAEIRAIVTAAVIAKCGQYGGMPAWSKLPQERRDALRYELNRIRAAADRYHAESLLARVVGDQTAYWNRLRELEQLLGFEIDSSQDLSETDLDTILANPGAPV